MVSTHVGKKGREQVTETLSHRFARLRDELVVRNHLAGLEVKEAVGKLTHEIDKIAHTVADNVGHTVDDAVGDLSAETAMRAFLALQRANERLAALDAAIREGLAGNSGVVDEAARLQLALAKMDAAAAVDDKTKAFDEERRKIQGRARTVLTEIEARLERFAIAVNRVV